VAGGGGAVRTAHVARVPEAELLISFHILVEGQCWGGLNGEALVRLEPEDVIAFPVVLPILCRAPLASGWIRGP